MKDSRHGSQQAIAQIKQLDANKFLHIFGERTQLLLNQQGVALRRGARV